MNRVERLRQARQTSKWRARLIREIKTKGRSAARQGKGRDACPCGEASPRRRALWLTGFEEAV